MNLLSQRFLDEFHRFVNRGVFPRPNRGEWLQTTGMFSGGGIGAADEMPTIRIMAMDGKMSNWKKRYARDDSPNFRGDPYDNETQRRRTREAGEAYRSGGPDGARGGKQGVGRPGFKTAQYSNAPFDEGAEDDEPQKMSVKMLRHLMANHPEAYDDLYNKFGREDEDEDDEPPVDPVGRRLGGRDAEGRVRQWTGRTPRAMDSLDRLAYTMKTSHKHLTFAQRRQLAADMTRPPSGPSDLFRSFGADRIKVDPYAAAAPRQPQTMTLSHAPPSLRLAHDSRTSVPPRMSRSEDVTRIRVLPNAWSY
jgi:hypothetical protein